MVQRIIDGCPCIIGREALSKADLLQVDFALDLLPQVVVRHQLVILISQRVNGWGIFQLQADAQLAYDIVDRQTGLNPCPYSKALLCSHVVCGNQASLCVRGLAVRLGIGEGRGGGPARATFRRDVRGHGQS